MPESKQAEAPVKVPEERRPRDLNCFPVRCEIALGRNGKAVVVKTAATPETTVSKVNQLQPPITAGSMRKESRDLGRSRLLRMGYPGSPASGRLSCVLLICLPVTDVTVDVSF